MAGQFRSSVWDPVLIVSQIICMQCVFYVGLGTWVAVLDFITGTGKSLDQFYKYEEFQFKDNTGKLNMTAFLLNSLTCAVGLWYVVRRTKLCLDFTATAHFIHLITCWIYNGSFPHIISWWLVNIICIIFMTVCGEYLCMRTELKAIPLGLGPKADL